MLYTRYLAKAAFAKYNEEVEVRSAHSTQWSLRISGSSNCLRLWFFYLTCLAVVTNTIM